MSSAAETASAGARDSSSVAEDVLSTQMNAVAPVVPMLPVEQVAENEEQYAVQQKKRLKLRKGHKSEEPKYVKTKNLPGKIYQYSPVKKKQWPIEEWREDHQRTFPNDRS